MLCSRPAVFLPLIALAWSWNAAYPLRADDASHLAETTAVSDGHLTVNYDRDIRPILSDKCFRCHGPDESHRESGLRLDQVQSSRAQLDSGKRAIVPGDPSSSELLRRIESTDDDERMPPASLGKTLSALERTQLRRWIEAGAAYNSHWSFTTATRPALPDTVAQRWVRNPIDAFVLRRLQTAQRQPAPEANKATLLRRVTQDLTGLPPTPEELAAYLRDARPDAYEQWVDYLLSSPRYGEHRARYWLDVARYGDTHGLHLDNERSIWPFRDWVIRAFNADQPFDQFTIEQIAGDLLPSPTIDQKVATGFLRCNVTTSEGGSIDEEYLVRYAMDRTETTATTWLGLTVGCAACHDHKFDPIPQREYYSLYSYFFSMAEKAMDGNALLPPPAVKVANVAQRAHLAELLAEQQRLAAIRANLCAEYAARLGSWSHDYLAKSTTTAPPRDWFVHCDFDHLDEQTVSTGLGQLAQRVGKTYADAGRLNGAIRFEADGHIDLGDRGNFKQSDAFSAVAWLYLDSDKTLSVVSKWNESAARGYDIHVDAGHVVVRLSHHWPDNALCVQSRLPISRQKWQHIGIAYDGSGRASGVRIDLNGEPQELVVLHDQLSDSIVVDSPLQLGRCGPSAPFQGMMDEVYLFARPLRSDETLTLGNGDPLAMLLATDPSQRSPEQSAEIVEQLMTKHVPRFRELLAQQGATDDRLRRLEGEFASTLIAEELSQPRQTHLLVRGQYDQPGAEVQRNVLSALPALPPNAPANRLALARWLVSDQHPLTARVTVNRIWQQFFGSGLVATPEDFGAQGAAPSHPELLDWLAVEFRESGWDVKQLIRTIVTSATYRQSSDENATSYAADPDNRLLGRGPRFRMDAEMIRDQALFVSGLFVEQTGGASVRPYQPPGLWEAVGYTTSNTAKFTQDHGAALYRRSLYTFWKRTSPPPTMQILDAPSREVCTVKRPRTNTPTAALALMNDVQFVEAARGFATRLLLSECASDDERLQLAFQWAVSRDADEDERTLLLAGLAADRADFRADAAAAQQLVTQGEAPLHGLLNKAELAAWTLIASTLLNLDETLTKH